MNVMKPLFLFLTLAFSAQSHAVLIASFDSGRSSGSFVDSAFFTNARNDISSNFAGASFTSFSTLTAANLSGVDIFQMGFGTSALNASEQTVLLDYIQGGGTVFAQVGSNPNTSAVLSLFGLEAGSVSAPTGVKAVNYNSNAIIDGPFGTVASYSARNELSFSPTGGADFATREIIELTNAGVADEALLALLPRGTSYGAGQFLFYTNGSMWGDHYLNDPGNQTLLLNLVDSAANGAASVPVPSPALLLVLAGGLIGFRTNRRRGDRWTNQAVH